VRIFDRKGRLFWSSPGTQPAPEAIRERTVISTAAGGLTIETALRLGSAPTLIPSVVRRAQRWTTRALVVVTLLLAAVSLLALRGERAVARGRRAEAMQQLALGLRHELNNALASVLLNAELLAEQEGVDPALRERMIAIVEQAERMRDVLRRLEQRERLDTIVPYLDDGFMVDLSPREAAPFTIASRGER
jgi:signal transduction histidine kinase